MRLDFEHYVWDRETGEVHLSSGMHEMAKEYQKNRTVEKTQIGDAEVSTVFLVIDHSFRSETPMVFETMIFGGRYSDFQNRYSTLEDAKAGHQLAVYMVMHPIRWWFKNLVHRYRIILQDIVKFLKK